MATTAWRSRLPAVTAALQTAAVDAGLVAGGEVLKTRVREALRGGYTSGLYVTGNAMNTVRRTEAYTEDGARVLRVYSDQTDPPYPLYWELGFVHAQSGRHYRVEKWRPALLDARLAVADAFTRVARARIEQAAA